METCHASINFLNTLANNVSFNIVRTVRFVCVLEFFCLASFFHLFRNFFVDISVVYTARSFLLCQKVLLFVT